MRDGLQLVKVATLAGGSLLIVALTVACLLLSMEVVSPSELWGPRGAFRAGLYATLLLGAGPAMLLGVPAYWLLWRAGLTSWPSVIFMGGTLGALVVFIEPALAAWGVPCGILVAALTHLAARRWLERDPAFGPTLQRDAGAGEPPSPAA